MAEKPQPVDLRAAVCQSPSDPNGCLIWTERCVQWKKGSRLR